ncbi:hypothetical protein NL108_010944 [Boleophthalmus pectinirostris]|nr:hypothetical protein NL108_010944 [Boleophthalmus pectinirostris]
MVKLENMECPAAQCPDLKPIELVWDELDRRVKTKKPTSVTHLWELLQQTWEELSEEYLISIVKRTSHECVQLLYLPKVDTFMKQNLKYVLVNKTVNSKKNINMEKVRCSKTFDR